MDSSSRLRAQRQHDDHRAPALPNTDSTADQHAPPSNYNLMVAGMRAGKTAFLRLLLDTSTIAATTTHEQIASVVRFVQGAGTHTSGIRSASVHIDVDAGIGSSRLALTLVDTPSVDHQNAAYSDRVISDVLRFVDSRLAEGVETDWKNQTGERHIHLCVYFLDPDTVVPPSVPPPPMSAGSRPRTHSFSQPDSDVVILDPPPFRPTLPLSDIENIRRLSARVNVLPVIGRADTLSNERLAAVKSAVRRELADNGIGFGIFDLESDHHPTEDRHSPTIRTSGGGTSASMPPVSNAIPPLPYALISPDQYAHSDGVHRIAVGRHELMNHYTPSTHRSPHSNLVRGRFTRSYRWTALDVLDGNHTDFLPLRQAIFYHMETLQKYTLQYLFHKFKHEYQSQQRSLPQLPPISNITRPPPQPQSQHSFSSQTIRPILAIDTAAPPSISRQSQVPQQIGIGVEINTTTRPSSSVSKASSSKTSKGNRKKITVACNFCRSRKLKCDGIRPQCSQCTKRSNPCDYMQDRRRKNGNADQGDDSGSEDASDPPESMEPSLSPEIRITIPLSRRSSNADAHSHEVYQASTGHRGSSPPPSPPPSRPSTSSGARPLFSHNDLPHITTLASISDPSPATPMSAPSFPPIRSSDKNAATRKRASTVPGKSESGEQTAPPPGKIVACNFCRTRKTKCDGLTPSCSSCTRRSLPCNYIHTIGAKRGGTRRASTSKVASTPSSGLSSASSSRASAYTGPITSRDSETTLREYDEHPESPPSKKMRMEEPSSISAAVP